MGFVIFHIIFKYWEDRYSFLGLFGLLNDSYFMFFFFMSSPFWVWKMFWKAIAALGIKIDTENLG